MPHQSDSPTRIDQEISIDAPRADIYSFLAAPESIAEYWPGMALTEADEATSLAYAPPPEAVTPPLTLSVVPEVSEQNAPTSLTRAFKGELEGTKKLADDAVSHLVLVIRNERNCSFEEAVSVACGMIEDEIRRFQTLCQQLLEERDESDALRAHLTEFSELIAGHQKWEPKTVRYRHGE